LRRAKIGKKNGLKKLYKKISPSHSNAYFSVLSWLEIQFMHTIASSELILNQRGAIYHLDALPEEIAHTIITVGDPNRVETVSKHFDRIEYKCAHREFITHTGYIGSKRLSVVSTGIGTDNIDIVLHELDALVNIDFDKRMVKNNLSSLQIIRLGTSGCLQADIDVDNFVVSTHAIGVDNLLNFYTSNFNEEEQELLQQFNTHTGLNANITSPYIFSAASSLLKHFTTGYKHGITVTCPGFYGPQGRVLRLGLQNPTFVDRLTDFSVGNHRIANFEMETSGIYGLGKLMGHQCLSISTIVANRVAKTFSKDGNAAVENMIKKSLEIIEKI
jgi:uridine phosphorylase